MLQGDGPWDDFDGEGPCAVRWTDRSLGHDEVDGPWDDAGGKKPRRIPQVTPCCIALGVIPPVGLAAPAGLRVAADNPGRRGRSRSRAGGHARRCGLLDCLGSSRRIVGLMCGNKQSVC